MLQDKFFLNCSLQNKIALVTGGATGLGFGMAECMIAAGATVIIVGRRTPILQEACSKLGEQAHYYQFDITDWEEHQGFAKQVIKDFGKIDVLVNNAGNQFKAEIKMVKLADFSTTFDVHVKGSFALTRAFLPYMIEKKTRVRNLYIFYGSLYGFNKPN